MKRFLLLVACMLVSAPLTLTNSAVAAGKPAAHARPSASRPAPARTGSAQARPHNVHPGASPVAPPHAKQASTGNAHANSAKANHTQTNAGKNGTPPNGLHMSGNKNGATQPRSFPARGYRGFSNSSWLPNFGIYAYYNPDDTTWYYWYEPSDSFLPVSYLNDYPPAAANMNSGTNGSSGMDGSLLPRQ